MWSVAKNLLNGFGWKRSLKLDKQFWRMLQASEGYYEKALESNMFKFIDTSRRSGEDFTDMVKSDKRKVTRAAKGREIHWINDQDSEWDEVIVLFGTEKELITYLKEVSEKLEAIPKPKEDKDEEREHINKMAAIFRGDKFGITTRSCSGTRSYWIRRKDGWRLKIDYINETSAFRATADFKDNGTMVEIGKDEDHWYDNKHFFSTSEEVEAFISSLPEDREIKDFDDIFIDHLESVVEEMFGLKIERCYQRVVFGCWSLSMKMTSNHIKEVIKDGKYVIGFGDDYSRDTQRCKKIPKEDLKDWFILMAKSAIKNGNSNEKKEAKKWLKTFNN